IAQTEEGLDDAARERLLAEIAAIDLTDPAPAARAEEYVAPRDDFDDAPRGSATWSATGEVATYGRFELTLEGPSHGNPFVDVALDLQIDGPGVSVRVPGFYDGDGIYRARYMPEAPGSFRFATSSNASSLDGISGSFVAGA